jgi:hypothetical protein
MLPAGKGRFCSSCAKTVVDFTGMTEKQIAAHFRDQSKQVCGRIESRQMERTYEVIPQIKLPMHQRFWGFLISIFVSGVSVNKAVAQPDTLKIPETDTLNPVLISGFQADSVNIVTGDTLERATDSSIAWVPNENQICEPEVYVLNIEHMIVCGGMQAAPVETGPSFLDFFRDTLKRSFFSKGMVLEKSKPSLPKEENPKENKAPLIEAVMPHEIKIKGEKRA